DTLVTIKEKVDYALAIKLHKRGVITTPRELFKESNKAEIKALIERGVFYIITYNEECYGKEQIFKSQIVRKVKGKNKILYKKLRLVI
ncbi:hypothetical protein LX36DRAFT_584085, partial [Colletotrichum falcatum]